MQPTTSSLDIDKNARLPSVGSTIRTATLDDLPAIRDIYNWAVENTTATFDTEPRSEAAMRAWFEAHGPRHPVVVFERAGIIAGWGSLSAWSQRGGYRDTVELSVYVHPDARGTGIGSGILDLLVKSAQELGHHCLLSCNTEGNEAIETMVSQRGFERVGVIGEIGSKFNGYHGLVIWQRLLGKPEHQKPGWQIQ